MKIAITIDMDNDDFQHECDLDCGVKFNPEAVRRILEDVTPELNDVGFHHNGYKIIRDINGNTVGKMELT